MDKKIITEELQKLYEQYGQADMPEVTPMENPEEYLRNNGAITLDEFIARVGKLCQNGDK
ncbi:MAG: hypothetical protein K5910_08635 [Bacteroidales bacterium]|nr:hypothetical protein [Bacteroidales bacterium]